MNLSKLYRPALLALALITAAPAAFADMVSTRFTLPGMSSTSLWDIGNGGELVGQASDLNRSYGFVYDDGILTRLDGPAGSVSSSAIGISDSGIVIGNFSTSLDQANPYSFYYKAGTYVVSDLGLSSENFVEFRGISPNGRYVTGRFNNGGFVYDLSLHKTVSYLDDGPGSFIIVQGINNFGQLVGNVRAASGNKAFLYDINTGVRNNFSFAGASAIAARGINDHGQVAGWLTDAAGNHAWVGNASGYQLIPNLGSGGMVAEGINNQGQVVGFDNSATGSFGFIASLAVLPVSSGPGGSYSFSAAVVADVPIFIDPLVAIGYRYEIGAGDPLFKTVSLPAGIGDGLFDIEVEGLHFSVGAHETFDFTAHGFAGGVAAFTVTGIEPEAMLDPADGQAFVTQISFAGSGMFTGTQTALTMDYTAPVPEPSTVLLLLAGGGLLLLTRRRPA